MSTISLKNGTNSLNRNSHIKAGDIKSTDPIDKLIFEKGLRIKQIMADKKLNTMIVFLNNGRAMQLSVSHFEKLKKARQQELNNWELIGSGIGVRWTDIDEDLSLKGLIKESAISAMVHRLEEKISEKELSFL